MNCHTCQKIHGAAMRMPTTMAILRYATNMSIGFEKCTVGSS